MTELVANLKTAMAARIEHSDWMSAETEEGGAREAREDGRDGRLSRQVARLFEAEDRRRPISTATSQRSNRFEWEYQLSDLGKPVDRKKWGMTPQTVNAYNGGLENKIVFPAGILQAPFFDPKADPAVNYGAIGAIIGHEISHGFDDQGRKIDATGAVRDWWTKADADRFDAAGEEASARSTDAYEPVPGMHVNGELTMGENIADLAGVLVALDAYHASLQGRGRAGDRRLHRRPALLPRLRPGLARQAARRRAASSRWRPTRTRRIASASSVRCATYDAWYKAFEITGGKYFLKPEERTRIW